MGGQSPTSPKPIQAIQVYKYTYRSIHKYILMDTVRKIRIQSKTNPAAGEAVLSLLLNKTPSPIPFLTITYNYTTSTFRSSRLVRE